MICLLYKDVLCLACGGRYDPIYTVVACIDIHSTTIEEVDNGRGMPCPLCLSSSTNMGFLQAYNAIWRLSRGNWSLKLITSYMKLS